MPDIPTAPVELKRTALPFPIKVDNLVLTGTAKTFTKPAGAAWALISVTALCFIRAGGTAIVPVGDVTNGEGSFPVHAGQDVFFNVESITSFTIIGTATGSTGWFRDHSTI